MNKPKFRIEYAFASDETITFNKKDKLLINKLYSSVRDILPDFSITAGNNDMFDNDVCGDYSFQEVWDLLEKYNKTEVLREWNQTTQREQSIGEAKSNNLLMYILFIGLIFSNHTLLMLLVVFFSLWY